MLNLYRDPDGNHVFSINDPLGRVAPLSTIFVNDVGRTDCKECQELKARVKKLEQTITEVCQVHSEAIKLLFRSKSHLLLAKPTVCLKLL